MLKWIESYLTDRTQVVWDRAREVSSAEATVRTGVPQGSVLGPLLFSLYISDFKSVLRHSKYNFYADDLQVYLHCEPRDLHRAIDRLNEDIASIEEWAASNKLILNGAKTQAMLMGTARYLNSIVQDSLPDVTVGGSAVRFSTQVKYLGVTIASNLSWDAQVAAVTRKVWAVLYQLKMCSHLLPQTLRSRLITTLAFPHIDYCSAVFTDITSELDLKLYRVTNACLRFVYGVRRDQHITPYYKRSRWLKVTRRREYFVGCLLHNIIATK